MNPKLLDLFYADNPIEHLGCLQELNQDELNFALNELFKKDLLKKLNDYDLYFFLSLLDRKDCLSICDKIIIETKFLYIDTIVKFIINNEFTYYDLKPFKTLVYILGFYLVFIKTNTDKEEEELMHTFENVVDNLTVEESYKQLDISNFDFFNSNKTESKKLTIDLVFDFIPKNIVQRCKSVQNRNLFFNIVLNKSLKINIKNSNNYYNIELFDLSDYLGVDDINVIDYFKIKNNKNSFLNYFYKHRNYIDIFSYSSAIVKDGFIIFNYQSSKTFEVTIPLKEYIRDMTIRDYRVIEKISEYVLFHCPEGDTPYYFDFYRRYCSNSKKRHKAIYLHKLEKIYDNEKHQDYVLLKYFSMLPAHIVVEIIKNNNFTKKEMEVIMTIGHPYSRKKFKDWKDYIDNHIKN